MAQKLLILESLRESTISFRWFRNSDIFFVIFSTFWNSIVLIMVSAAIADAEYEALLFMSVHILAGFGVGWYTLAQVLNKTTVKISRFELSVTHSPIPMFWRKSYELNMKEISEIEVYEKTHRNKGQRWFSYGIQCKIAGKDKEVKVIQGIVKRENAEIVKEQILAKI